MFAQFSRDQCNALKSESKKILKQAKKIQDNLFIVWHLLAFARILIRQFIQYYVEYDFHQNSFDSIYRADALKL